MFVCVFVSMCVCVCLCVHAKEVEHSDAFMDTSSVLFKYFCMVKGLCMHTDMVLCVCVCVCVCVCTGYGLQGMVL